ncbi:MAG TPA: hypothetical protein VER11_02915 [Polyangiaceae bacterium]|nr:hypothetical protein [Polyangiaceae bacterium]
MKRVEGLLLACVGSAFWACSAPNRPLPSERTLPIESARPVSMSTASESDGPFRLTASIRELMDSEVDPAADFIWASVASISTVAGLEERQPRTDDEWLEVRRRAITLIEATNLLVMKGRRVSAKYEAASGAGELDTDQVQQKIDTNRPAFVALAQRLQDTGLQTLAAIDAKDPVALFDLGGTIDEACESCHVTFWYPNLTLPYR